MCASQNVTSTTVTSTVSSNSQKNSSKPIPKWLKMKQQNKSSAGKQTAKPIAKPSLSSAQPKPSEGTREEKRKRWAKKSKPVAKPVAVKRGPAKEYISVCCSAPAQKPPCGTKTPTKDPDSGKMKDKASGLGHFRCSQCKKACKVRSQAPAPKEIVDAVRSVMAASVVPVSEVTVATA